MLAILDIVLTIASLIVFAAVIVSWVAPGSDHPAIQLLRRITEPVFSRVRRLLPDTGGIDLSPMVVLGVIWLLRRLIF